MYKKLGCSEGAEVGRGWRLRVGTSRSRTGLPRTHQVGPAVRQVCSSPDPILWGCMRRQLAVWPITPCPSMKT